MRRGCNNKKKHAMAPKKATGKPSGADAAGASGQPAARPLYTMSILKNGDPFGTLIFELAVDVLPRTTENFKQLSQGVTVGDKKNPKTASYKGCRFLRLTSEGLQAGDALQKEDGKGNDSIYGPTFEDEALRVYPHTFGTLSMVNSGPNSNGSQFFICCLPRSTAASPTAAGAGGGGVERGGCADSSSTPVEGGGTTTPAATNNTPAADSTAQSAASTASYLDSRHVAFGKLMEGSEEVFQRLLDDIRPFANTNEDDDGPSAGAIDVQSPFCIGAIAPL